MELLVPRGQEAGLVAELLNRLSFSDCNCSVCYCPTLDSIALLSTTPERRVSHTFCVLSQFILELDLARRRVAAED